MHQVDRLPWPAHDWSPVTSSLGSPSARTNFDTGNGTARTTEPRSPADVARLLPRLPSPAPCRRTRVYGRRYFVTTASHDRFATGTFRRLRPRPTKSASSSTPRRARHKSFDYRGRLRLCIALTRDLGSRSASQELAHPLYERIGFAIGSPTDASDRASDSRVQLLRRCPNTNTNTRASVLGY